LGAQDRAAVLSFEHQQVTARVEHGNRQRRASERGTLA